MSHATVASLYVNGRKRRVMPKSIGKIFASIILLLSVFFATFPAVSNAAHAGTDVPYIVGSLCSNNWQLPNATPPSSSDFLGLKSFDTKATPDGVLGDKVGVTAYIGEWSAQDMKPNTYEDGTQRPAFGGDDDFRVYPNGESDRGCVLVWPSVQTGILNFVLGINAFIWKASNWVFETAVTSSFTKTVTKSVSDLVTGDNGLSGIFLEYVGITIIIVGLWLILQAYKSQVMSALTGAVWTLAIFSSGLLFMANPTAVTDFVEEQTSTVQASIISGISSVSQKDPMCKTKSVTGIGDVAQMMSCASWKALVYEPTVLVQWGTVSSNLNEVNGQKAPEVDFGSAKVSNWGLWNLYSQIKGTANEEPIVGQQKFMRVVDVVAGPGVEHTYFNDWAKRDSTGLLTNFTISAVFLFASAVLGWNIATSAGKLIIYSLIIAMYIFLFAFVLVIGVHPVVGKRVMKKWGSGFAGQYMWRIVETIYLASMMLFVVLALNMIGGENGSLTEGVLFLIIVLMSLKTLRSKLSDFFGVILQGESDAGEDFANKAGTLGKKIAVGGTLATGAAATAGYVAHRRRKKAIGGSRVSNALQSVKESDKKGVKKLTDFNSTSRKERTEAWKDAKDKTRNDAASGNTDMWGGKAEEKLQDKNAGLKRGIGESQENFNARVARERQLLETHQANKGKSVEELEANNYGVKAGDYETKADFQSAVEEKRAQHQDLINANVDKKANKEFRGFVKQDVGGRTASAKAAGAGLVTAITTPSYGGGMRAVGYSIRKGTHAGERSLQSQGENYRRKLAERARVEELRNPETASPSTSRYEDMAWRKKETSDRLAQEESERATRQAEAQEKARAQAEQAELDKRKQARERQIQAQEQAKRTQEEKARQEQQRQAQQAQLEAQQRTNELLERQSQRVKPRIRSSSASSVSPTRRRPIKPPNPNTRTKE